MSTHEQQLLSRWARKGDAHAFDELVRRYADMVYGTCRRILQNEAEAEDATQESFLRLSQSASSIRTSVGGWLHVVATRESLQRLRADKRRREREQRFVSEQVRVDEPTWKDLEPYIDEAIAQLPEDLRFPVVASFLERKTHAEIADELGVDRSTVTRRIDRGVEAIRGQLRTRNISAAPDKLAGLLAVHLVGHAPGRLLSSLGRIGLAGPRGSSRERVLPPSDSFGAKGVILCAAMVAIAAVTWWLTDPLSTPETPLTGDTLVDRELPAEDGLLSTVSPVESAEMTDELSGRPAETVSAAVIEDAGALPGASIAGRVVDKVDGLGVPDATVMAQLAGGTGGSSATTDADGRFEIEGLESGAYELKCEPVDGYPETTREIVYATVTVGEDQTYDGVEIMLNRGGVVDGVALYAGEPLRELEISISAFLIDGGAGEAVFPGTVTTDHQGRFRLEGLGQYDGEIIGSLMRDGQRQSSAPFPVKIEYNKTTEVTLDFVGGSSMIEGHIYLTSRDNPLSANVRVYFTWYDADGYKEDVFRTSADDTGYFRLEGLPAGNAELHVYALDSQYIDNFEVPAGVTVSKDIVIPGTMVVSMVRNVPDHAKHVYVTAHPGEDWIEVADANSLIYARDTMVAVTSHSAREEIVSQLSGLEPGTYRITAAAWPTEYNLAEILDYGRERFYKDLRFATSVIEVERPDQRIELELDFLRDLPPRVEPE